MLQQSYKEQDPTVIVPQRQQWGESRVGVRDWVRETGSIPLRKHSNVEARTEARQAGHLHVQACKSYDDNHMRAHRHTLTPLQCMSRVSKVSFSVEFLCSYSVVDTNNHTLGVQSVPAVGARHLQQAAIPVAQLRHQQLASKQTVY